VPVIHQLDSHVADLIAAGEVVERPASAVKELTENSIDAGAKNIAVEIQNGGMTYLRITDDGCGMEPADARTAFLRHATSKIRTGSDLASITTLGFRGEALAAISAVSKIDLLTKTPEAEMGTSLHLDAGVVTDEQPAGCPDGTTLIVRELFYNTPARMKFMKSDTAEGAAVFAAVQRQALAHPEVSFRFLRDGAELLHTAGDGGELAAVYTVLGRQTANDMVAVDSRWDKLAVRGFVTKPTATRGTRANQFFFVNGRFVKSKLLAAALEEAYRNQIMTGRFPACVLYLTLPPQAVDVNVHPAKTEVKFLSEHDVFDAVHYGVLSALGKTPARPEMKLPEGKPAAAPAPREDFFKTMKAGDFAKRAAPAPAPRPAPARPAPKPVTGGISVFPDDRDFPETMVASEVTLPRTRQTPPVPPEPEAPAAAPEPEQTPEPEQKKLSLGEPDYRVVGEVLDTYFVVEQAGAVLFIDKHAAHERILFEKLRSEEHPILAQVLMSPIQANLSREEAAAVLENAALLEKCGYEVEDFGGGSVLIRQIPGDLDLQDAESGLQELAGELLGGRSLDPGELRDRLLHTIACKAAIKAGYHTEPPERDALVREVLSREELKYCPHGRPICITLTKRQLEKQFKRV
jgi:DNA mismatch repair protein MutL